MMRMALSILVLLIRLIFLISRYSAEEMDLCMVVIS